MNKESEKRKKKQLGQFFSGKKLSNLLAAFISDGNYLSIIDPMCGTGDLLRAAGEINPKASLVGIDIDLEVTSYFNENSTDFPNDLKIYTGNVFSQRLISELSENKYDLVIANPPYVRYQSLSDVNEDATTSAKEIRNELVDIVSLLNHLDNKDKDIFNSIIKGYSGLADLAVPSWILSAMLTKEGGRLAIIVPESWLNREYAFPIHYLLLKFFNIEFVIEDLDRVWFKDNAQVKTNLIIAKRVARINNLSDYYQNKSYLHVGIPNDYDDVNSIIGKLYPFCEKPEIKLFQEIKNSTINTEGKISIKKLKFLDQLDNMHNSSKEKEWYQSVEETYYQPMNSITIPSFLKNEIPQTNNNFSSLSEFGIHVGQGLRTGANKFFYVDEISELEDESLVLPNKEISRDIVAVPNDALKTVIRKQNELPKGYCLDEKDLKGRVLILNKYINSVDRDGLEYNKSSRTLMPLSLSNYIIKATNTNLGNDENPKFFSDLSAVKPNIRAMKNRNLDTSNFWYMLPQLTQRHLPEIFVARINGKIPKFYINTSSRVVVDANFSTIWMEDNSPFNKYSLLALLNSDWVLLCCELLGSIMGAGALKLEAVHLKKIPVPHLSVNELEELTLIGKGIIAGTRELEDVNSLLAKKIFKDDFESGKEKINYMLLNKFSYRTKGKQ